MTFLLDSRKYRAANPMVHTQSRLAKPRFCMTSRNFKPYGADPFWVGGKLSFAKPEREASSRVHTHSRFAKPQFCIRRMSCEPYGAQSVSVGQP
jgi:hypothetical protein